MPYEEKLLDGFEHPKIRMLPPDQLIPYANNARTHSRKQLKQIAASIERFGFTNPVLIAEDRTIIAGHGRAEAAKALGLEFIPTIALAHLGDADRQAYILADNQLALNAGWDRDILAIELQGLIDVAFDVELTGFDLAKIDFVLDGAREAKAADEGQPDAEDIIPPVGQGPATTRMGDIWVLGRHRLICGDARDGQALKQLTYGKTVDLVFTDPPYNVPIKGHVNGLGINKHREFAFASGEMSKPQFTAFLTLTLSNAAACCKDGAIAYVCMDWRHMGEMLAAGEAAFADLKNVCVWNKTNGGMGSFYRSKHEMIFVWKVGDAPHTNTFGLGDTGRYRTNVWDYAGVNVPKAERNSELAMHPTVKPVGLIADALRDCSRRGETVLDVFAGSGSTLIAAETCGRSALLVEYDPLYCDTILQRFEAFTGQRAVHATSGLTFEETALERAGVLA